MNTKAKKRFNALDFVIVLVVIAAVAAFFLRGQFAALFAKKADHIVTYTYRITDVPKETAASLKAGVLLYSETGKPAGEALTVETSDATDAQTLSDGRTVYVKNGLVDLEGTVTANGYDADGFVYLECGMLLVPGSVVTLSTGDALFLAEIVQVQLSTHSET